MNDGLIDGFRHNAWATDELLKVCQELSEAQLDETVEGTFGTIIETLRHIISSEAGYQARLMGEEPSWDRRADEAPGLDELAARNEELLARWERFLSQPFDAERTLLFHWDDETDRDVPAGVVLMQALHHGNEHRSQVATILTQLGFTPPEWGLWDWAEKTDRAKVRAA